MKLPFSQPQRLLAALLVFAAVVLAGCGFSTEDSGGGSNDSGPEGITLYSGRIPAAIGPAVDSYEAEADLDVAVGFGLVAVDGGADRGRYPSRVERDPFGAGVVGAAAAVFGAEAATCENNRGREDRQRGEQPLRLWGDGNHGDAS